MGPERPNLLSRSCTVDLDRTRKMVRQTCLDVSVQTGGPSPSTNPVPGPVYTGSKTVTKNSSLKPFVGGHGKWTGKGSLPECNPQPTTKVSLVVQKVVCRPVRVSGRNGRTGGAQGRVEVRRYTRRSTQDRDFSGTSDVPHPVKGSYLPLLRPKILSRGWG